MPWKCATHSRWCHYPPARLKAKRRRPMRTKSRGNPPATCFMKHDSLLFLVQWCCHCCNAGSFPFLLTCAQMDIAVRLAWTMKTEAFLLSPVTDTLFWLALPCHGPTRTVKQTEAHGQADSLFLFNILSSLLFALSGLSCYFFEAISSFINTL